MEDAFYKMSEGRREAFQVYYLQEIANAIVGVKRELGRIADSLEKTDKKTKEEMVDKIKKALDK